VDIKSLRAAWVKFLQPHPWAVFITLTFDQKRRPYQFTQNPEKADKDFRRLIRFINEELHGKRWLRKTSHKGVIWARVREPHRDGALHYHACLYSPSEPITPSLIRVLKDWWESKFGMARSEVPRSKDAVVEYLTKHVGNPKLAEIDLSYNFPRRE